MATSGYMRLMFPIQSQGGPTTPAPLLTHFLLIMGRDPVLNMSQKQNLLEVTTQHSRAAFKAGHREPFKLVKLKQTSTRQQEELPSQSDWQVCLVSLIGQ